MSRHCSFCRSTAHVKGSKCLALRQSREGAYLKFPVTSLARTYSSLGTLPSQSDGLWLSTITADSKPSPELIVLIRRMLSEIEAAHLLEDERVKVHFSVYSPTTEDKSRSRVADWRRNPILPRLLRMSGVPRLASPSGIISLGQLKLATSIIQRAIRDERIDMKISLPTGFPCGRGGVDFFQACRDSDPLSWSTEDCIRFITGMYFHLHFV